MKNSIADAHYKTHVKARWKMVFATIAMATHAAAMVMMVNFLLTSDTYLLDSLILAMNAYSFYIAYRYRRSQQQVAMSALQRYNAYRNEVAM